MNLTQRISAALAMMFGGGAQLSNRNGFVDGAFANWQVGAANPATLAANAGTYVGPTMWRVGAGAGGAGTVQSVDLRASGDLAYMEGEDTVNAVKVSITAGSTGTVAARTAGAIWQPIEYASKYAGKSVTVQFKLKSDVPITIPYILAAQVFGTGGSPSAQVLLDKAVNWVVGTTFKKFSVRLDIPSTLNKTFGTNIDSFVSMGLWLPPGVTFNLTVAEAQIESCSPNASLALDGTGGSPTSFEHRGLQAELARVQRHYETGACSLVAAFYTSGCAARVQVGYRTTKRGLATVTYTPNFNNGLASVTQPGFDPSGFLFQINGNVTSTAAESSGSWIADARL